MWRRPQRPNSRPGDWTCPECKANVFASKTHCFRCNAPKPTEARSVLRPPSSCRARERAAVWPTSAPSAPSAPLFSHAAVPPPHQGGGRGGGRGHDSGEREWKRKRPNPEKEGIDPMDPTGRGGRWSQGIAIEGETMACCGPRLPAGPAGSRLRLASSRSIAVRAPCMPSSARPLALQADSTASGPLFQQRPYPAPGAVLAKMRKNPPKEEAAPVPEGQQGPTARPSGR